MRRALNIKSSVLGVYALSAEAVRSYMKAELVNALLRHFAGAHAATDPTPAQVKALEWLPEAMLFPAVDPDAPQEPETEEESDTDESFEDDSLDKAA